MDQKLAKKNIRDGLWLALGAVALVVLSFVAAYIYIS